MKRKDYENYKWYPVTDETYWVEEYCDEFLISYRDYLIKNKKNQDRIYEAKKHTFFAYKNN